MALYNIVSLSLAIIGVFLNIAPLIKEQNDARTNVILFGYIEFLSGEGIIKKLMLKSCLYTVLICAFSIISIIKYRSLTIKELYYSSKWSLVISTVIVMLIVITTQVVIAKHFVVRDNKVLSLLYKIGSTDDLAKFDIKSIIIIFASTILIFSKLICCNNKYPLMTVTYVLMIAIVGLIAVANSYIYNYYKSRLKSDIVEANIKILSSETELKDVLGYKFSKDYVEIYIMENELYKKIVIPKDNIEYIKETYSKIEI